MFKAAKNIIFERVERWTGDVGINISINLALAWPNSLATLESKNFKPYDHNIELHLMIDDEQDKGDHGVTTNVELKQDIMLMDELLTLVHSKHDLDPDLVKLVTVQSKLINQLLTLVIH